jgi:hypothetical protein
MITIAKASVIKKVMWKIHQSEDYKNFIDPVINS